MAYPGIYCKDFICKLRTPLLSNRSLKREICTVCVTLPNRCVPLPLEGRATESVGELRLDTADGITRGS